jgi:hypothetical protein
MARQLPVFFFCMDELVESTGSRGFTALTGILVPAARAHDLRHRVYQAFASEIQPSASSILMPPELHLSDFLRHRSDDHKLSILADLVGVLVSLGIRIYRSGYRYNRHRAATEFARDPELRTLLWLSLWVRLQPVLKKTVIVPVLDAGFDRGFQPVVDGFSDLVRFSDVLRTTPLRENVTTPESVNMLEVLYVDSKYSTLVQLADLVSGLCRISERAHLATSFKAALREVAAPLSSLMEYNSVTDVFLDDIA